MRAIKLTHERLLQVLDYNRETGVFTWKITMSKKKPAGKPAGSPVKAGYLRIMIDGERFLAHRLAWFYVFGVWPKQQIDHQSVINSDNRLCELREATQSQNQANRGLTRSNTSGYKGVTYSKKAQKWQASIRIDGRLMYLGQYHDAKDAHMVYAIAANIIHGNFARMK